MQELELTWSQVIRIWWAIFWRWLVLNQFTVAVLGAVIGIPLLLIGHREWVRADQWALASLIAYFPSAAVAVRLALKAPHKGFRVVIAAPPPETPQ